MTEGRGLLPPETGRHGFAGRIAARFIDSKLTPIIVAASLLLGVFAVLGVSGAIAALGDTLFPVTSLAAGFTCDFDPSANLFVRLRVAHIDHMQQ